MGRTLEPGPEVVAALCAERERGGVVGRDAMGTMAGGAMAVGASVGAFTGGSPGAGDAARGVATGIDCPPDEG